MMFGIETGALEGIYSVFKRHPEVEKVIIYGSRAKGNCRRGSDIDLTLIGSDLTEQQLSIILLELDELNTPYQMDVSIFEHLQSPDLEAHIARVGRLFYPVIGK